MFSRAREIRKRQRMGDNHQNGRDQGRRHQEIRLDALVHPRLEIAVPGEHRRGDDIVLYDRVLDRRMQGPGIANAGRATVAHEVEAETIEMALEVRLRQVVGNDPAPRGKRGLDERPRLQTPFDRLFREESSGQHDARVR